MRPMTLGDLLADVDDQRLTRQDAARMARMLERRNRLAGVKTLGQVLEGFLDWAERDSGARWPVIRSGERTPIPAALRWSIYLRDDRTCTDGRAFVCSEDLELDHLIPWSAGGPDDSDNLRTCCSHCNTSRSNFCGPDFARNYLPTTWWCCDCWRPESAPRNEWKDGTDPNRVPRIKERDEGVELVFCAHCRATSYSPLFFIGDEGRHLLALIAPNDVAGAVA